MIFFTPDSSPNTRAIGGKRVQMLHSKGQTAMAEMWNSEHEMGVWMPCIIVRTVVALDRDYRINIVLCENGAELSECAPECIVPYEAGVSK